MLKLFTLITALFSSVPPEPVAPTKLFHTQSPYYIYEVPWPGVWEAMPWDVVQEMELREKICAYDLDCHLVYPISEEAWNEVTVFMEERGYHARRMLVR